MLSPRSAGTSLLADAFSPRPARAAFLSAYYSALSKDPEKLAKFYAADGAAFTFASSPTAEGTFLYGKDGINDGIAALGFAGVKVDIASTTHDFSWVDSKVSCESLIQPSFNPHSTLSQPSFNPRSNTTRTTSRGWWTRRRC